MCDTRNALNIFTVAVSKSVTRGAEIAEREGFELIEGKC